MGIAKHGRVGIVTLPGRFNYGNRLQNFAASRIWESLGYEPETLVLAERPNVIRLMKQNAKRVLGKVEPNPESLMSPGRLAAFDRFNENIATRHLDGLDSHLHQEYDLFSVGSDQVWNLDLITYNDDWYFLKFAMPEQRIAFAPSVGLDSLNTLQAHRFAKGLRGFTKLSVRERRGAELIKECTGMDAEVLCDPTLVLSASDWRMVADERLTPNEPYIFSYLLGGVNQDAKIVLDCVTNHGDIPVLSLSDREKPGEPPAGPAEFIDLVDHALHVVTDSYHAAVFACMMNTPLTIIRRSGKGSGMFSRLETLGESFGIQNKIYGSTKFDQSRAAEFVGVEERISCERAHFRSYFQSLLVLMDSKIIS